MQTKNTQLQMDQEVETNKPNSFKQLKVVLLQETSVIKETITYLKTQI